MNEILRLVLVAAQAAATAQPPPPRARPYLVAVGALTIAICLAIASGFILTALWVFLLPYLGPVWTPLALAGMLLLTAGAVVLVLRTRPARAATPATAPVSISQFAPILAEAGQVFNDHKLTVLIAALLAGVVAGSRRG